MFKCLVETVQDSVPVKSTVSMCLKVVTRLGITSRNEWFIGWIPVRVTIMLHIGKLFYRSWWQSVPNTRLRVWPCFLTSSANWPMTMNDKSRHFMRMMTKRHRSCIQKCSSQIAMKNMCSNNLVDFVSMSGRFDVCVCERTGYQTLIWAHRALTSCLDRHCREIHCR